MPGEAFFRTAMRAVSLYRQPVLQDAFRAWYVTAKNAAVETSLSQPGADQPVGLAQLALNSFLNKVGVKSGLLDDHLQERPGHRQEPAVAAGRRVTSMMSTRAKGRNSSCAVASANFSVTLAGQQHRIKGPDHSFAYLRPAASASHRRRVSAAATWCSISPPAGTWRRL